MNSDAQMPSQALQELTPIICGNCGSTVPLVDAEICACIYCGARVDIPADHRRGQEARRRLQNIRKNAVEFLSRIGRQPKRREIWLAKLPSWLFFSLLLVITVTGFSAFLYSVEFSVSSALGTNFRDLLPEIVVWPLYGGLMGSFPVLALAFFFLVRRRVFVTRRLLSVLAAGEPVKPGGPATCRRCGAPFLTEAGDLVAACDYCGTENFLNVPHDWLSATRRLTTASGRNVFWAEREFDREMTSSRTSLNNQLKLYAVFLLFIFGAFLSGDSSKIKVWQDEVAKTPRNLPGICSEFPDPQTGMSFRVHGAFRKYSEARAFEYRIALRANEKMIVATTATAAMKLRVAGRYDIQTFNLAVGRPVEFKPAIGGWFNLHLIVNNADPLPDVQVDLHK